jgi:hypothetical protein
LQKKLAPALDMQSDMVKKAIANCMMAREKETRAALVTEGYLEEGADEEVVREFYRTRFTMVPKDGQNWMFIDLGKPSQKVLGSFPTEPTIRQRGNGIDITW